MISQSNTAERITQTAGRDALGDFAPEEGNLVYRYYYPADDPECVLLVDRWRDQAALDAHHASPMMARIVEFRDKYNLHMRVERFADLAGDDGDKSFIRE